MIPKFRLSFLTIVLSVTISLGFFGTSYAQWTILLDEFRKRVVRESTREIRESTIEASTKAVFGSANSKAEAFSNLGKYLGGDNVVPMESLLVRNSFSDEHVVIVDDISGLTSKKVKVLSDVGVYFLRDANSLAFELADYGKLPRVVMLVSNENPELMGGQILPDYLLNKFDAVPNSTRVSSKEALLDELKNIRASGERPILVAHNESGELMVGGLRLSELEEFKPIVLSCSTYVSPISGSCSTGSLFLEETILSLQESIVKYSKQIKDLDSLALPEDGWDWGPSFYHLNRKHAAPIMSENLSAIMSDFDSFSMLELYSLERQIKHMRLYSGNGEYPDLLKMIGESYGENISKSQMRKRVVVTKMIGSVTIVVTLVADDE